MSARDQAEVKGRSASRTCLQKELAAANRAISLANLTGLQRQRDLLAQLVADGVIGRAGAADGLFEAAQANDLIEIHGVDSIQRKPSGPVSQNDDQVLDIARSGK